MISSSQRKKLQDEELKQRIKNEVILQQSRFNYNKNIFIPAIEYI